MKKRSRRADAGSERVYMHDIPVRELQQNIASLTNHPEAHRAAREQRISITYTSAAVRVLLEQSEQYVTLLACLSEDGASSAALRAMALDRARVSAELFLSARREQVNLIEHAFAGMDPTVPLCVLDVIEACNVELAGDDLDEGLLMRAEELDAWLHSPARKTWVKAVPPDERPPRRFGAARGRRALERAMEAGVSHPKPTDRPNAERIVRAVAECLQESAAGYRSLAFGRRRRDALTRAREINRLMHGTWRRTAFDVLEPRFDPVWAAALLKVIMESLVVLAAPAGDFDRYGMTARELDEALSAPELRSWQSAVAALPAGGG